MFTGLIEEIGVVKSIVSRSGSRVFTIQASTVMSDLKVDDSISVNGACQTVVRLTQNTFEVVAVPETLLKTTLSSFVTGNLVNLERAVRVGDRLGGHIVQGHVDCVGSVSSVIDLGNSRQIWIEFPNSFSQYVVPVGSICINGVSLTIARVQNNQIMVAVIPHTLEVTTLRLLKSGVKVNLEFDIIGKYIEKLMFSKHHDQQTNSILHSLLTQPTL